MHTQPKDEDFDEFFARLYCKSIGINPDKCWSDYADLGNSDSYVRINWEIGESWKEEQIKVKDALDIIAKRILSLERRVIPEQEH
jgi:hypothetical protein